MRKLLAKLDWLLLLSVIFLIIIGIFMIFSTSIGDNDFSFVIRQILYALVGLLVGALVLFLNYRFFLNTAWFMYFGLILLLVVTFILGLETRGSTRWIDFGFFTLQASEIAKPILVLTLTVFFLKNAPIFLRNVFLSILIAGVPTLLVFLQPDLGSAMVLGFIWLFLVFLAGVRLRYFFGLGILALAALPVGLTFLKDYQKERLLSFLNPASDPLGSSYNLVQSIIAVGSGQFFGLGFGRGTQSHLNFLPEQKTDFIFATTAEELGFVGITIILVLFATVIVRLFIIGNRTENKAGSLICYGAALVVAVQLFINSGMNMGLLPITGITLPFVSFGGSSLISLMILIALAQSVHLGEKV